MLSSLCYIFSNWTSRQLPKNWTTGKQRYIAVTSELLANVSQTECLIQLFGFLQNVVSQDRPPAWPGGKLRGWLGKSPLPSSLPAFWPESSPTHKVPSISWISPGYSCNIPGSILISQPFPWNGMKSKEGDWAASTVTLRSEITNA